MIISPMGEFLRIFSIVMALFASACFPSPVPQGFNSPKPPQVNALDKPAPQCGALYAGDEGFEPLQYKLGKNGYDKSSKIHYMIETVKLKRKKTHARRLVFSMATALYLNRVFINGELNGYKREGALVELSIDAMNTDEFIVILDYHGENLAPCLRSAL